MRRCAKCGYDLTGLPRRHRCPECGLAYDRCATFIRLFAWRPGILLLAAALSTPALVIAFTRPHLFLLSGDSGHSRADGSGAMWTLVFMCMAAGFLWPVVRSWVRRHSVYVSHAGIWLNTAADEDRHIPWANVRKAVFDEDARLLILFDTDGKRLLTYESDVSQSSACARRAANTINRLRGVYLKERGPCED